MIGGKYRVLKPILCSKKDSKFIRDVGQCWRHEKYYEEEDIDIMSSSHSKRNYYKTVYLINSIEVLNNFSKSRKCEAVTTEKIHMNKIYNTADGDRFEPASKANNFHKIINNHEMVFASPRTTEPFITNVSTSCASPPIRTASNHCSKPKVSPSTKQKNMRTPYITFYMTKIHPQISVQTEQNARTVAGSSPIIASPATTITTEWWRRGKKTAIIYI